MDRPCEQRTQCLLGHRTVAWCREVQARAWATSAVRPRVPARLRCGPPEQRRAFLMPRVRPPDDPCSHTRHTIICGYCSPLHAWPLLFPGAALMTNGMPQEVIDNLS